MREAEKVAANADIILLSVGDNLRTVGESASRLSLDLPGRQSELIDRIVALGKPVVLIHTGGRPASLMKASKTCDAIIQNFYAGEQGADALGNVLNGNYNPSGKLPVGILKHVGQVPLAFPIMPSDANRGNAAAAGFLYPFGYGLSYTSFEYSDLSIDTSTFSNSDKITVSFSVKNSGEVAGDEIVQLYFRDNMASVVVYDKELCGFDRVSLQPGETKTVSMEVNKETLSIVNSNLERVFEPGKFTIMLGSSSEDIRLEEVIEL